MSGGLQAVVGECTVSRWKPKNSTQALGCGFVYLCTHLSVCVCVWTQTVWTMAWGIRAQTGPSGTAGWLTSQQKSATLALSLPASFLCFHSSAHTLTDRPQLCSLPAELPWPLWGSHAGGAVPATLHHRGDILASLFPHSGEDLVSSSSPHCGMWNQALSARIQWNATAERYFFFLKESTTEGWDYIFIERRQRSSSWVLCQAKSFLCSRSILSELPAGQGSCSLKWKPVVGLD